MSLRERLRMNYPQIPTRCRFCYFITNYIANFYSKRRQRQSGLTPLEVRLERAKAADREAISGALRRLRKTNAYMAAGAEGKQEMEEACKAGVIQRRYISTVLSFNFY
jgi:hypothetical protein